MCCWWWWEKKLVVAIFRQTARRNLWNCNSLPQYFIATQELNNKQEKKITKRWKYCMLCIKTSALQHKQGRLGTWVRSDLWKLRIGHYQSIRALEHWTPLGYWSIGALNTIGVKRLDVQTIVTFFSLSPTSGTFWGKRDDNLKSSCRRFVFTIVIVYCNDLQWLKKARVCFRNSNF